MKTIKYLDGVAIAIGSLIGGLGAAYFTPDLITAREAVDLSAHFFFLFTVLYFFVAKEPEKSE